MAAGAGSRDVHPVVRNTSERTTRDLADEFGRRRSAFAHQVTSAGSRRVGQTFPSRLAVGKPLAARTRRTTPGSRSRKAIVRPSPTGGLACVCDSAVRLRPAEARTSIVGNLHLRQVAPSIGSARPLARHSRIVRTARRSRSGRCGLEDAWSPDDWPHAGPTRCTWMCRVPVSAVPVVRRKDVRTFALEMTPPVRAPPSRCSLGRRRCRREILI